VTSLKSDTCYFSWCMRSALRICKKINAEVWGVSTFTSQIPPYRRGHGDFTQQNGNKGAHTTVKWSRRQYCPSIPMSPLPKYCGRTPYSTRTGCHVGILPHAKQWVTIQLACQRGYVNSISVCKVLLYPADFSWQSPNKETEHPQLLDLMCTGMPASLSKHVTKQMRGCTDKDGQVYIRCTL
jgi:hypothetical protein